MGKILLAWTEEPGELQSMRLTKVGHDLATKPSPPSFWKCEHSSFILCQDCFSYWGPLWLLRAPLIAQLVKNPSAMQETPVQFLDWEDPLKKG